MTNGENIRYALLSYTPVNGYYNIGDYIQSYAASRFLPRIDFFINREELHLYDGPPVKIILNGWFMNRPENFPPSKNIIPLFVSFHIAKEEMLTTKALEYLKKYEPIGCRDLYTKKLLKNKGIKAYFSGCLTLTLPKNRTEERNKIFCVDIGANFAVSGKVAEKARSNVIKYLKNFYSGKELKIINETKHDTPFFKCDNDAFEYTENLLKEYSSAKIVITSRLHTALPCLAMGTPVLFLNFNKNDNRFGGLLDLFNLIDFDLDGRVENVKVNLINNGKITRVVNSDKYLIFRPKLNKVCQEFIKK